ncbi:putative lipid II flippase FtsW [Citricoccus muralis]|uniref:Probable peptidoglycan glycosyltransferase FtsW n=1 Tax=Citricoccus muralis TaxID=169134 RepID=A0A3D9LD29_9MICC|nr:putative lipid II flippase FtsW [Citricoccus muralis]REE03357.1 cell division protein FtsW [Citricoccus muralis]
MVTTPHRSVWRRAWGFLEGQGSSRTSYFLILGCTAALTVIGLVMVLSSSSVENIGESTGSYDLFIRQAMFAVVGFVGLFVLSRLGTDRLRSLGWPAILLAVFLLALVLTPLGHEVNGNKNWLKIGSFTAQPSEAAKLALALWAAVVLERKAKLIGQLKHSIVPVIFPVGAILLGLIMYGRDLGTAMVIMMIMAAVLFLAGARLRYFLIAGGIGALGAAIMALTSANRAVRIQAWLGNCEFPTEPCYQPDHGMYALASGGWWGVGLGQSRQKWSYIPEAENDFIFTILGEELGLAGTLLVIGLFAGLAIGLFRVARRSTSLFVRIATGGILIWIVGQAFINIAMVTGLLPVIGVPLPFISYGGSALTFVLAGVGVVLAFAREQRQEEEGAVTADASKTATTAAPGTSGPPTPPAGAARAWKKARS